MRVLTVCAGNICRSPAAEAAIAEAAGRAGLELDLDSAGTGSWHIGEPPHHQIVEAGERVGLAIDGRARRFAAADFDRFDVILVMDRSNLRHVLDLAPSLEARAKVRLFRTYDPGSEEEEVPDPWGGPDRGYDQTVTIARAAAAGFVDSLVSTGVDDPVAFD